jgi:hypothetical protein
MATTARETDERWPTIVHTLIGRGLDRHNAEIAADYVIECLDLQEARFEKEREPFG